MGEPVPQGQRNARYKASELVVALEHADLVIATLGGLGVGLGTVERSDDLGLGLLRLRDDKAAAQMTEKIEERIGKEPAHDPEPRERPTELDRLLTALRRDFALSYAGWIPTLGKNRLLGSIEGGGQIGHSGEDDPEPTTWRMHGRTARRPGLGVRVGVLDTAVFPHPDFEGRWIGSPADVLDREPEHPIGGHGTFVTGLVLRKAPGCTVEVCKALSDDGTAESWDVAKKIVELGRTGLDVLNLSMVCWSEDSQPPLVLATAIDRLDPDIVVVAAAGNHGNVDEEKYPGQRNKPAWPAALDDVIAVGAADDEGDPAKFTPPDAPWVDVWSNGVDVSSTFPNGVDAILQGAAPDAKEFQGYAKWSGSSFAAALVSGAIAAGTVPGRTPARAAWNELRGRAKEESAKEQVARPRRPPFLQLLS
ncbi:MAG: S8/S53 family peptidase [Blastococcus sp.]